MRARASTMNILRHGMRAENLEGLRGAGTGASINLTGAGRITKRLNLSLSHATTRERLKKRRTAERSWYSASVSSILNLLDQTMSGRQMSWSIATIMMTM